VTGSAARAVAAFDRAAGYDDHAHVQRAVATWLAEQLKERPRPARLLEIGAGTGFLREACGPLADDWLLTDLSPAMLRRAQTKLAPAADLRFALLDAAHPVLSEPPFDVVTGSLVVQWFDDLAEGLDKLFALVAPGGTLAVTTLAAGSFAEWRQAHEAEGYEAALHRYPDEDELAAICPAGAISRCAFRTFRERHRNGPAFLHALKGIGAGTPRTGHRPLGPVALRRVLHRWEANGATICYRVAMLSFTRPA
jgi:malonyl-CoA O-methyltransferase